MTDNRLECLNCTLPICDDSDKRCSYRIERLNHRQSYFAVYYKANRERKIAAASARNKAKKDNYNAYMREYQKRKRSETTST